MRTIQQIDDILSSSLEMFMKQSLIPGIAVGVVLGGELAYAKGFGVRNIDTHTPVNQASMFHSASISKTFVATALMQLYEKGLLNLDMPVTVYVPYFRLKDERYKKITVKQMMSHTSGMPDVYDYEWEKPEYGEDALENYIRSIYDLELLWEPGERAAYSNLAYEILGDVIAKISGMSFEEYIRKNLLQPLGMKDSSFLIREVEASMMTSPHILKLDKGYEAAVHPYYPYNRIHGPSSTLWSNVNDLCRYAIANLNKGSIDGVEILQKDSFDMMWKPCTEAQRPGTSIGLCWFLKQYKGADLVFHTGGDTGYTSNLVLMPDKDAALVFYCNCDYINLNIITEYILDIILGFEAPHLSSSAASEVAAVIITRGIAEAQGRFEEIKKQGTEYYFSEADFNSLAYRLLKINKLDEAIAVLDMAISELPNAANLYDSLGEMYLNKGEREKAVENYKKAIMLNPGMSTSILALKNLGI